MAIRVIIDGKGHVAEFPDGTDPGVIDKVIQRDYFSGTSGQDDKPSYNVDLSSKKALATNQREMMARNPDFQTMPKAEQDKLLNQSTTSRMENFKESAKKVGRVAMPYVRPVLEGGGAVAGGIVGAGSGALTGLGLGAIPGGVAGSAIGYAGGAKLSDLLETATGQNSRPQPQTVTGQMGQSLADLGTGATYEMGGQVAGKVIPPVVKGLATLTGKVAKPILGRLSGTGVAAIDESIKSGMKPTTSMNPLKSSTTYDKALRGDIKGEEIVDTARTALTRLKDARSAAYQADLNDISTNMQPIDLRPVKQEVSSLMAKYNVRVDPTTGALDTSRIAMGKTGRNDIKEIIETVSGWGTKQGDNTPLGLDVLKRQLDDFYSDSSQARQFVSQIRNNVKDAIVKAVPQYDDMTKGYTEATKIIKDVEAGLMLRKQGMSGRVVADQTLRRLMSSMRDNFALRKDLVDILGNKGGADLGEAIAGYTQNSVVPMGLAGTGPAILGSAALAKFFDPAFAAVIVASSPRVQGEFLRMIGKGIKTVKATGPAQSAAARQVLIQNDPIQGNN